VSTLRVRLFGALDLERDGRQLDRFSSRKARDLFAYLAVHRRGGHGRDQLAGIFWGDSSDDRARHALNTTLWRINRVLGARDDHPRQNGCLRITAQHIAFNTAADVWLDVAEFESRCRAAEQSKDVAERIALYEQAISFYRGDLLPDSYEDWCVLERERLQSLYVRALSRVMGYHAQRGDHAVAIDCGMRILGCDQLQEEVHRDLIQLYLDSGQPAAALKQYRICEELLREELAVAPAPETRALLTRIMGVTHAAPNVAARPIGTPVIRRIDVASMAAQLDELSALCDTLRAGLAQAHELLARINREAAAHSVSGGPRLREAVG